VDLGSQADRKTQSGHCGDLGALFVSFCWLVLRGSGVVSSPHPVPLLIGGLLARSKHPTSLAVGLGFETPTNPCLPTVSSAYRRLSRD
jgi:hypothetical protein